MNAGFILLGALIILTTTSLLISVGSLDEILAGPAPGDVHVQLHAAGALLHWISDGLGVILLGRSNTPRSTPFER